jgi:hypothetical protein
MRCTRQRKVLIDGDGYLTVIARNNQGLIYVNKYAGYSQYWQSWSLLPGATPVVTNVTNSSEQWVINSDPAVSSWGPGRMDVFIVAQSANS